jgi:putative membrane protein
VLAAAVAAPVVGQIWATLSLMRESDEIVRMVTAKQFIIASGLAMAAATRQHLRTLKLIRRDDFLYSEQRSISIFTAVALTIIGIFAFVLLVMGSPFT